MCCGSISQNKTGTKFQFVPYRGAAPIDPGPARRPDRSVLPGGGQTLPQCSAGKIKAYAVMAKKRWCGRARHADHRRGRRAGPLHPVLARPVGAEGHAEGRHRQAQCRGGRRRSPIPAVRSALPSWARRSRRASSRRPEALAALHKAEIEKWWPIIKAANIRHAIDVTRANARARHDETAACARRSPVAGATGRGRRAIRRSRSR